MPLIEVPTRCEKLLVALLKPLTVNILVLSIILQDLLLFTVYREDPTGALSEKTKLNPGL